ncbi:MAG: DUF2336 domain-containing protein [Proteobacteria bacterium]|nr:DUF2336 domain-containing protein [Pseudomonadota bacterium]
MPAATSLIPGLDEIVERGDPQRRAKAIRQISELFVQGAGRFQPEHVDLFDGILTGLVPETGISARAELAERLAAVPNAPPTLVKQLVRADEVAIAGPLLRHSPVIDEPTLMGIARAKGQGHLLAISGRPSLSTDLTDVIVSRGDREVVRSVAGNGGALFSSKGYAGLIKRAGDDGILALTVGQREDISPASLESLLACSVDIVRRRLFEAANPARKAAINKTMISIVGGSKRVVPGRDFSAAQRAVISRHQANGLHEASLLEIAKAHNYEESVAMLSAMSGVRISTVETLMMGERHDPILIMGKSLGLEWATVRALILLRLGRNRVPSVTDIEMTRVNFERLVPSTAQRVMDFWKTRQSA